MGLLSSEKHVPIVGLSGRWIFRLTDEAIDADGVIRAIRLPFAADLLAAAVLERLCQELRLVGFSFAAVETGRGTYAGSICDTSEINIGATLARIDATPTNPSQYELEVSCQRLIEKRLFSRAPRAEPSARESELWRSLEELTTRALTEKIGAADVLCHQSGAVSAGSS